MISTVNSFKINKKHFSIGQILPLNNMEGEVIIAFKNRIAALSAAEAVIWDGSKIIKVGLPYVTVKHARWSADGEKIFIGTGLIDAVKGRWIPNLKLTEFTKYNSYGSINSRIKTITWNKEGTYAAVLLEWTDFDNQQTQQVKLLVFDIRADVPPVLITEPRISDVRIIGNHIVIVANEVTIWSFTGHKVARMSPTLGVPFRINVTENETYFLLMDMDWSTRIIDTNDWKVVAIWKGYFQDIAFTDDGLIALDLKGQLHAACFSNGILEPIRQSTTTGLSGTQIATVGNNQLIIMGIDLVSVHSITYEMKCAKKDFS